MQRNVGPFDVLFWYNYNGKQHNKSITPTQNTLTFKIGFEAFQ